MRSRVGRLSAGESGCLGRSHFMSAWVGVMGYSPAAAPASHAAEAKSRKICVERMGNSSVVSAFLFGRVGWRDAAQIPHHIGDLLVGQLFAPGRHERAAPHFLAA